MTWLQRYRIRAYVRDSIWILPVIAMAVAAVLVRVLHAIEDAMEWRSQFDPETIRTVLGTLAGSIFTFMVFVCSSLLLVVQLASAQLSPRIIGVLFRDRVTKVTLALFVFTFVFTIATLVRIGATAPRLTADVAAFGSAGCLGVFLYLIDHIGKMLRPSGALRFIAGQAHQVIDIVYPRRFKQGPKTATSYFLPAAEASRPVTSTRSGVVLAFDIRGLVALAVRHDCVIELIPQVGNFVAPGGLLFRIYGETGPADEALRQSIALGVERTVEQDPTFGFRVIVDIASKGLSPAINDPTTAVLAIDRIHHLLRHVGGRSLEDEGVHDAQGRVRLVYRTPDWEDFVTLAVTEIRQFGGSSIQVVRRLRAMLEDLVQNLPSQREAPLEHELALVQRTAERLFTEPEDRALAQISDAQGVGGTREAIHRNRPSEPQLGTSPESSNAVLAEVSTDRKEIRP